MIDIHCHILPGIDDGAATIADSIRMAEAAVANGIHTIIATPHHRNGKYENIKNDILLYTDTLNKRLQMENIALTILPGQETRLNGDMVTDLQQGELLTQNNKTNYLFVEFPYDHVPRYGKQLLFDIQVAGYTPIIVHPERNRELIAHPSMIYDFVRNGALTQVTAASLVGKFGKNTQKLTHQLIEANTTHFIATDAHNTTTRGFCLQEAYNELQEQHGNAVTYLFIENCELLLDGLTVNKQEPFPIEKKKFLGLF